MPIQSQHPAATLQITFLYYTPSSTLSTLSNHLRSHKNKSCFKEIEYDFEPFLDIAN